MGYSRRHSSSANRANKNEGGFMVALQELSVGCFVLSLYLTTIMYIHQYIYTYIRIQNQINRFLVTSELLESVSTSFNHAQAQTTQIIRYSRYNTSAKSERSVSGWFEPLSTTNIMQQVNNESNVIFLLEVGWTYQNSSLMPQPPPPSWKLT